MASSAPWRSKPSSEPVTTRVLPASAPPPPPTGRGAGGWATTPTATSSPSSRPVTSSAKKRPMLAATVAPTPGTASKRSPGVRASSAAQRPGPPAPAPPPHDRGGPHGRARRHPERAPGAGTPHRQRARHLGDDVAGLLEHDVVADADVLAAHLVEVVQRGPGDRRAGGLRRPP